MMPRFDTPMGSPRDPRLRNTISKLNSVQAPSQSSVPNTTNNDIKKTMLNTYQTSTRPPICENLPSPIIPESYASNKMNSLPPSPMWYTTSIHPKQSLSGDPTSQFVHNANNYQYYQTAYSSVPVRPNIASGHQLPNAQITQQWPPTIPSQRPHYTPPLNQSHGQPFADPSLYYNCPPPTYFSSQYPPPGNYSNNLQPVNISNITVNCPHPNVQRDKSRDESKSSSDSVEKEGSSKYKRDDRRSRDEDKRRTRSRSRSRDRNRRSKSSERSYRSRHRSRSNERHSRSRRSRSRDRRRYSRSSRSRSLSCDYRRRRPRHSSYDRYRSRRRSYSNERRRPRAGRHDDERARRDALIEKWRRLNCRDDDELEERLLALSKMDSDQLLKEQQSYWIRSAPATTYYERDSQDPKLMRGTAKLEELCAAFTSRLIENAKQVRASQTLTLPPAKRNLRKCIHHHAHDSCSSNSEDEEEVGTEESQIMEELQRKMDHPYRLHQELWYNEPGEMNDGPLCKCSVRARRSGIRHGIYSGETKPSAVKDEPGKSEIMCNPSTNNAGRLYHYRITISPPTNFLSKTPTIILHDGHEFIFAGFSLFSHYPLPKLPVCKVIRFNIEYIILYAEESYPENFTIRECDLFFNFLFREILELVDLDLYASPDRCPVFHFMPRFVRELVPEGHELLPMCVVLKYLLTSFKPLIPKEILPDIPKTSTSQWQDFADDVKGMIVTKPGMKPSSIRVDQLDKEVSPVAEKGAPTKNKSDHKNKKDVPYPEIIHFGIRPPQLSYAGNQDYQKAWREYIKQRHLIANLAKPTTEDKQKLAAKESELQRLRMKSNMKRDVTATVSSEGFYRTGLMCDVVQHAMLIPVLACHLRFHRSLNVLEEHIGYVFKNRSLLQLALTHPSYRENFGTNPDHARNSLTNCGIRQPEYGDRRIHYMSTKKRGINTLMTIMSRFGSKSEEESNIYHNERLEFLGDAVVEFVSTIHLFHMFRDLEEGGLATYRAALVQNQHLAVLAKVLNLDAYLLYAHGSDLCHDLELNHALANCFEALMGALFLDGGVDVADRVFGQTVFGDDEVIQDVWVNYLPHPLQDQEPEGDRRWIEKVDFLKNLTKFEDSIGVEFTHIRLLARAFTDRSVGYTNLTLGSNQRLEFLGDSVLQLVASEYLYKHFPEHHEGHLSLLRSSLVNNNTQSVVCDDLGMTVYARYAATKGDLKVKDKADLIEAFLGALYIDKGSLEWVEQFCKVCFFPRLQDFIMNQEWNDPKSKLQQCCLTLRTMDGGEPDIPCYKVVECKGPTNTRTYSVAVYFRRKRMATASGHSIQQAEMNAAQAAMQTCGELFPQLAHQSRAIGKHLIVKSNKDKKSDKEPPIKRERRRSTPERYRIRKRRSSSGSSRSSRSRERSRGSSKSPRRKRKYSESPSRSKRKYSKSPSPRKDSKSPSPRRRKDSRSPSHSRSKYSKSLSPRPRGRKYSKSPSPRRKKYSKSSSPEKRTNFSESPSPRKGKRSSKSSSSSPVRRERIEEKD